MDIFTIQKIMGHSTLSTTRKYVQLDTASICKFHNQANVLESILTNK